MRDDLVKRVRPKLFGMVHGPDDEDCVNEVLGAIEALTAEVDALEHGRVKWAETLGSWVARAKAAEAEAARLREALVAFNEHFGPLADNVMLHEGARNCFRLARKALRGKEG